MKLELRRIRLTANVFTSKGKCMAGSVIKVPRVEAEILVRRRCAVWPEDEKPEELPPTPKPKPKPKAKRKAKPE